MPLSVAQLQALKTDLANNTNTVVVGGVSVQIKNVSALPNRNDAAPDVANWYNLTANGGSYVVWRGPKTAVSPAEYTGPSGVVWTEVDALTVGKARIFEWLTRDLSIGIDASDSNKRQGILDAFGSGTTSRTNLTALAKRSGTNFERVFATGTGTTGSPADLAVAGLPSSPDEKVEGPVASATIIAAWSAP